MTAPRRPSAGRRPARPGTRASRAVRTPAPVATVAGRPDRNERAPRRSPLTPRAAVLALLVCGLLASAALPLRDYLAQRSAIAALEERQSDTRARIGELEAEKARLQDPAYVAAEARRRLHFVLPGETAYVVLGPPPAPPGEAARAAGPQAPWYSQLWASVTAADRPAR